MAWRHKLDSPKLSKLLKTVQSAEVSELQRRIVELQDQIHEMRSEEQALKSINIVLRHEVATLRSVLRRTQILIDGIRRDWGSADRDEALRRSQREAEVIGAILTSALTQKENK